MLQKMTDIREMQERLTMKHFEIDQLKMVPDTASNTSGTDTGTGETGLHHPISQLQ